MKAITRDIGSGDEAIMETLSHMKRLTLRDATTPDVKALAAKIRKEVKADTSLSPEQQRLALVKGAFDWVVDNITYRFDHDAVSDHVDVKNPKNTEFVIAPKHLLTVLEGDCDDMSVMLASILLALGFEVNFKVIAWRSKDFTHVYIEVKLPTDEGERWVPMDPVAGAKGFAWEKAPVLRKHIEAVK